MLLRAVGDAADRFCYARVLVLPIPNRAFAIAHLLGLGTPPLPAATGRGRTLPRLGPPAITGRRGTPSSSAITLAGVVL